MSTGTTVAECGGVNEYGWPCEGGPLEDLEASADLTAPCPGQLPIAGEPDAGER
jgi:hypothetical protein